MKPAAFDYEAPRELDEALALLARHGDEATVLAGGQSLMPLLNFRLARPGVIVDVNGVAGLDGIERRDGGLLVGALVRQARAERAPEIASAWPLVPAVLRWVGHPQIRNRGTVGGSVAHADPAAELPAVLAALAGRVHLTSAARGTRSVGWQEFFVGPLTTAREPDELLVALEAPAQPPGSVFAFQEFARRHGDFALGGAAVVLEHAADGSVARASIALLAAGPVPLRAHAAERALEGHVVGEETARAAAAEAVRDISPSGDIHGSGEYRRGLIETLVRRTLLEAAARADGKEPA